MWKWHICWSVSEGQRPAGMPSRDESRQVPSSCSPFASLKLAGTIFYFFLSRVCYLYYAPVGRCHLLCSSSALLNQVGTIFLSLSLFFFPICLSFIPPFLFFFYILFSFFSFFFFFQKLPSSLSSSATLRSTSISWRGAFTHICCPGFYIWWLSFYNCYVGYAPDGLWWPGRLVFLGPMGL